MSNVNISERQLDSPSLHATVRTDYISLNSVSEHPHQTNDPFARIKPSLRCFSVWSFVKCGSLMVEGGREACQSLPSAEQELQWVAVILSTVLHCHHLHKETLTILIYSSFVVDQYAFCTFNYDYLLAYFVSDNWRPLIILWNFDTVESPCKFTDLDQYCMAQTHSLPLFNKNVRNVSIWWSTVKITLWRREICLKG